MLGRINDDPAFLARVLWTDESTFTRGGTFNPHNFHHWAAQNPHLAHPMHFQHMFKVNVWAGIIGDRIIGPHFFPGILNGQVYSEFIAHILPGLIHAADVDIEEMWFQQDGAPPHFAIVSRNAVNALFPGRWIGRHGPDEDGIAWPARSPDLTPCDFYLWGRIKAIVYKERIPNIIVLQERIVHAFDVVKRERNEIIRAIQSIRDRLVKCNEQEGGYIENLR